MKINMTLSIGIPTAKKTNSIEIDDENWAGMSESDRFELVSDWANNHIEIYYEEESDHAPK